MSAYTYAIQEVFNQIDREVLTRGYLQNMMCASGDLGHMIKSTTIWGRVLRDISLMGGVERLICTDHGSLIEQTGEAYVYHFSDIYLQGHSIVSALSYFPGLQCSSLDGYNTSNCMARGKPYALDQIASFQQQYDLENLSQQLNNANNATGTTGYFRVMVVAHNSIMVETRNMITSRGIFKVHLSYDAELNQIQPRNWIPFSQLVVAAVKSYLYNSLRSYLRRASLSSGQNYDIVTDIVSDYAGAEEEYQTLRTNWHKIAVMNSPSRHERLIRLQHGKF